MVRYNNNGRGIEEQLGVGGWGCLQKLKIVVSLGKHVSFTYFCEQ